MDVLSPSHLSAQYNDDEAPLYDGEDVNGVGVPFSWEEKPGVPLIMKSPKALERRKEEEEAKCGLHTQCTYNRREGNRMHENEKNVCVHENENVCVQNGMQENVCVSPLPKPPMTTTKQIHRRTSLHSYLHTKPSSLFMHKSTNHFLSDDPFLSAFHACSLAPTNFPIALSDHHDQFLNCSPASSLITQFDHHHQPASSLIKQFDHPPLNSKSSLSKLSLAHDKLLNHPNPQLSTQLEYASFRDYQFLPTNQSPLSKLTAKDDQALDTRNFISIKSPLSKLNEAFDDKLRLNSKPQLRKLNEADDRMLSTNPQLSELNYEAASEQKLQASYNYKSPVRRKSCNGSGRCEEKELAAGRHEYGCRTPVRKLIMQSEARTGKAQARYEGHPAFMVASFQRSPKQKKAPTITQKPAQGRSAHQRSSSYGGYGRCLGCASADSHDSIVRL